VDELRLVLGVNGLTAPAVVRNALQGASNNAQPVIVNGDPNSASAAIVDGIVSPSVSIIGWSFTIRADVPLDSGARYVRELVIGLTSNPQQPYWVEDVTEGWEEADSPGERLGSTE